MKVLNIPVFSCLLVVLGCVLGNGNAQSDDEFKNKGREIVAIFNNPSVNQLTIYQNMPALIAFYEKYSNRLQLTAQQQSDFDSLVRTYRQNKPTVGQPVQRGVWLFMGLFWNFWASLTRLSEIDRLSGNTDKIISNLNPRL